MDVNERAVLRRKSSLLAHVARGLNIDFVLRQCRLQGLLTDADVNRISAKDDKNMRVDDLLISLEQNGVSSFHKICFLFQRLDHEWVAEELRLELLLDKGWLEIDPYVGCEARVLAIRVIERLGKMDMNQQEKTKLETEIQTALSGRYQVAKNTWKQACTRKQSHISGEKMAIQEDITEMSDKLADFLQHDDKNDVEEGDSRSRGGSSVAGALSLLKQKIEKLETSWKTMEDEHESLHREQKLCLQLLNESNDTADLYGTLQSVINKCNGELGRTKAEIQNKREVSRTLDQQIRGLRQQTTRQLQEKEIQIDNLRKEKIEKKAEVDNYVQFIRNLKEKNEQTEAQITYWKQKCAVLEKTRRLGYVYKFPATSRDSAEQLWRQVVESVVHNKTTINKCNKKCSPSLHSSTPLSVSDLPLKSKASAPKERLHRNTLK